MNGRSFVLFVDFAARPAPGRLVQEANRVLKKLEIRPPVPPGTWEALRRPLALRTLGQRHSCPLTARGRAAPGVGFTLGDGPAYPVLGTPDGVAELAGDVRRAGWYAHKTLWAISPRYRGPVLIRGRRLDGPGLVRFGFPGRPRNELRAPPGPAGWRYGPSTSLVRGPGCYAFRVDGRGFRQRIVFVAR